MRKFPVISFQVLNELGEYVMGLPKTISSLVFTPDGKTIDEKIKEIEEKKMFEEVSFTLNTIWSKNNDYLEQKVQVPNINFDKKGFAVISVSMSATKEEYEICRSADLRAISAIGNTVVIACYGICPSKPIPVSLKLVYL